MPTLQMDPLALGRIASMRSVGWWCAGLIPMVLGLLPGHTGADLHERGRNPAENGYTAIEMMIAAAVFVLAAFTSITYMSDVVPVNRAKSAARQVASAMQQARQYAVANGATYTVTLTAPPPRIGISCTADCPPNPPAETIDIINDATPSIPSPPIIFGPMGTSASPNTVTVTYPGVSAWQVRVTGAGGIRTCSPVCL